MTPWSDFCNKNTEPLETCLNRIELLKNSILMRENCEKLRSYAKNILDKDFRENKFVALTSIWNCYLWKEFRIILRMCQSKLMSPEGSPRLGPQEKFWNQFVDFASNDLYEKFSAYNYFLILSKFLGFVIISKCLLSIAASSLRNEILINRAVSQCLRTTLKNENKIFKRILNFGELKVCIMLVDI